MSILPGVALPMSDARRWEWCARMLRALHRHTPRAGEAGSTAVELVLLTPVVLALTFLPIQAALLFHARHVVTAAAQEGARAARVADLDPGQAREAGAKRARDFTVVLGGRTVTDNEVSVNRSDERVEVLVTGHAMTILPGLALPVQGRSVAPVERFVPR